MTKTIIQPDWERTISFKNWSKGKDMAMTLITEPAGEFSSAFYLIVTGEKSIEYG